MRVTNSSVTFLWIAVVISGLVDATPASEPIRFGMSTALSGPTSGLGNRVRDGVLAAFAEQNRAGGIRGRELELISLDDRYEPQLTAPNMRQLIEQHQVVGILGNVGAPCAVVAVPIANKAQTPLIGYVTGGAVLRKNPPDRYVFNYRASLAEEVATLIEHFIQSGTRPERMAFLTQRDAYGDSVYNGGNETLKTYYDVEHSPPLHARYERNTSAVQEGLAEILLADPIPEVIILGAAREPAAACIRLAREHGYQGQFGTFSFVDGAVLSQQMGELAEGVVVTQVVPPFFGPPQKAHSEFRQALQLTETTDHFDSYAVFEGYLLARMTISALQRIPGDITRESLTHSLETMQEFDMGLGVTLRFDPQQHQASHTVWPTMISQGQVQAIPRLEFSVRKTIP